ncbi:MAG: stage II sporulation protein M [Acidobacteria bacterium]|nr:stage II sporulation protein M [Acidobacteriota bacterium]
MKQQAFEDRHQEAWVAFESLLRRLEAPAGEATRDLESMPAQYRIICHHLALARERGYAAGLVDRLNGLALRGHQRLYGVRRGALHGALAFFATFPRLVRKRWRAMALSALVFYGPGVALTLGAKANPEVAYLVEDPVSLASMESMYQSDTQKFGRRGQSDTDVFMFGFYIWNNIRINFQVFASGLIAGLGSIFFLFWNGAHGGAVAGYLTHQGLGRNFWSYVVTHAALELNSLIIAGGAGLILGWALLFPGRRSRKQAIIRAAKDGLVLVMGSAVMDVGAAGIEAFWSSSSVIPVAVKFSVAAGLWTLVLGYFCFAGRSRAGGERAGADV